MSSVVIRLRATELSVESDPIQMQHSALNASASDATFIAKRGGMSASDLSDTVACELDLLAAAKSGDQHAFIELCRRHGPYLKRRIGRIVRNLEDAEDVFQETLMSAFQHLAGFRAQSSFRTWIMRIATNTSLMLLRKRRRRPETAFSIMAGEGKEIEILQISDPMPNPEQFYSKRQARHRLNRAVDKLPAGFRLILEHHYQNEFKLVDAANAMGITVSAAKTRLFRARKTLRRLLKNS